MSAAQLDMSEQDATFAPAAAPALREQVAARLAAHRERRRRGAAKEVQGTPMQAGPIVTAAHGARSGRIAEAVAERYAHTQSYRAFLAAAADHSIRLAEALAEVAARNAEAISMARCELLRELEVVEPRPAEASAVLEMAATMVSEDVPVMLSSEGGLTVRLYEDVGRRAQSVEGAGHRRAEQIQDEIENADESRALDEEIAYRQSPTDDLEHVSVPIPGNLLAFPRHLVAPRKARPRYAEGPLREDVEPAQEHAQLRIFEVEAEQISAEPVVESDAPEWSSIWLDALAKSMPEETVEEVQYPMAQRPQTASLERRIMAGMVDGMVIGTAYVLFATVFAYNAPLLPALPVAAMASAGVIGSLYLLYQTLFFTLSEATPGMRYARIGLCTFTDENPTRAAMRRRTLAVLLAACPFGLGLLWAWLDDDRLGWHDRISRMYQRSY